MEFLQNYFEIPVDFLWNAYEIPLEFFMEMDPSNLQAVSLLISGRWREEVIPEEELRARVIFKFQKRKFKNAGMTVITSPDN